MPDNTDYPKDFDGWNTKKKECHYKETVPPMFKEKDIWWISVGVNIGFEEDGKNDNFVRPVLVLKKFNREIFIGVPLTTKIKENIYYVPITVKQRTVSAMISQIRVFSTKRFWNKLAELDTNDYSRVLEEIREFFVLPPLKQRSRG